MFVSIQKIILQQHDPRILIFVIEKAPLKDVKDEYVLHIKYLRINVREDSVQPTTDQIINVRDFIIIIIPY